MQWQSPQAPRLLPDPFAKLDAQVDAFDRIHQAGGPAYFKIPHDAPNPSGVYTGAFARKSSNDVRIRRRRNTAGQEIDWQRQKKQLKS